MILRIIGGCVDLFWKEGSDSIPVFPDIGLLLEGDGARKHKRIDDEDE